MGTVSKFVSDFVSTTVSTQPQICDDGVRAEEFDSTIPVPPSVVFWGGAATIIVVGILVAAIGPGTFANENNCRPRRPPGELLFF